jgi:hypothetical protein
MFAPPAPGALGDSARTALLAAMLAVVVGVLIAWAYTSTGRRRQRQRGVYHAPTVPAPRPLRPVRPPDEPPPASQLAPYVDARPAEKDDPPPFADPDAIHLNSASYEELRQVGGIDPVLAARILAYRRAHGEFQSLDELCTLTGLAPERLEASDGRRLVL